MEQSWVLKPTEADLGRPLKYLFERLATSFQQFSASSQVEL
jgi:hypothetical protein